MSRKFVLEKDYYDNGEKLFNKKTITINEGVTVLVVCNGIGKTTLIHQLKERLKRENIPCISFDNLKDGGSNSISSAGFYGDITFMANAMTSSEGEEIVLNIGQFTQSLRPFIQTGVVNNHRSRMSNAFKRAIWGDEESVEKETKEIPNERWLFFDAVDSGLSVDNIVDIKEYLFKTILEDNFDGSIYIVISANEYEMCRGENCFDVYSGKYTIFNDYEEYRNFILKSKEWKIKRIEDAEKNINKKFDK